MIAYRVLGHSYSNGGGAYFEFYFYKPPTWFSIKRQLRRLIKKISYDMTLDNRTDYQSLADRRYDLRCWLGAMPDDGEVCQDNMRICTPLKIIKVREVNIL